MTEMLGIYGDYWSSLTARSPWANHVAQRWDAGKAYNHLHIEERELKKIEDHVKEHKVTSALHVFTKWIREIKKTQKAQINEGMRQIFQDFHIIKVTTHFTSSLEKFTEHANHTGGEFRARFKNIVYKHLPHMKAELQQAEEWSNEDTTSLRAIINRAKDKGGRFVSNLRTSFKRKGSAVSRLGKWPMRMGIKSQLKDQKILEALSKELETIDKKLKAGKGSGQGDLLDRFEAILASAEKDILDMYKEAHLVMKRDLLLIIMILSDEEIMQQFGQEWVQEHFMPEKPVEKKLLEIEVIEDELAKKAHDIANGLGVVEKRERKIVHVLDRVLAEA